MKNIGWLFYKDYFDFKALKLEKNTAVKAAELKNNGKKLLDSDRQKAEKKAENVFFQNKNNVILSQRFSNESLNLLQLNADNFIDLVIENNGLITGVGVSHEAGNEGEYKLGFLFDYTTGLPIIQGSSVKGTLRSVFPNRLRRQVANISKENEKKRLLNKANQKEKYCIALFRRNGIDLSRDQLLVFEWMVFEGQIPTKYVWKDNIPQIQEAQPLSMYESDIFYDAIVVDSLRTDKRFLGSDFITPHKNFKTNEPIFDALVDPTPIQFLKILPNVVFRFMFGLKTIELPELTILPKQKEAIFRQILLDFGIGAKTNVGYGQLKPIQTP